MPWYNISVMPWYNIPLTRLFFLSQGPISVFVCLQIPQQFVTKYSNTFNQGSRSTATMLCLPQVTLDLLKVSQISDRAKNFCLTKDHECTVGHNKTISFHIPSRQTQIIWNQSIVVLVPEQKREPQFTLESLGSSHLLQPLQPCSWPWTKQL